MVAIIEGMRESEVVAMAMSPQIEQRIAVVKSELVPAWIIDSMLANPYEHQEVIEAIMDNLY